MNSGKWIASVALTVFAIGSVNLATQRERKEPTREEKLAREAEKLRREIAEIRSYAGRQPAVLTEAGASLDLADSLAQEIPDRLAKGEIYIVERLLDAGDDLQDAARYLANARLKLRWDDGKVRPPDNDDEDSRDAARELERAYFRTAQLNFLGRQTGADRMSRAAGLSRRLYQEGRAAFDRHEYFLAEQLALASRNLSSAVEKYVQSLLPADLPQPPKVPKR
jgi:hypothetical protein